MTLSEAKDVRPRESHADSAISSSVDRARIVIDGRELIHFGLNNYLGLAAHPRVMAALKDAVDRHGWGSAASSVSGGRCSLHSQLEERLATFVDAEAAILFSSGYAANLDVVTSLVGEGDVVFCDEQNHRSIFDAVQLSGAAVHSYRHSDIAHLSFLLRNSSGYQRRLIASESLFGTDGGLAPLCDLGNLAERHDAKLLIDESHAIGVLGSRGQGAAAFLAQSECLGARIGTLGKALGGIGGFVAGRDSLINSLAGGGRCYRHSTALPAAAAAAALAALQIIEAEPERRTILATRATYVRKRLLVQGWNVQTSASHIIPIWIDEPGRAELIAGTLRDAGYYLPCIIGDRSQTGHALLRLRINYCHEPWMIEGLISSFENYCEK